MLYLTCLPDEDHGHNTNQQTSDLLLFGFPRSKTPARPTESTFTRMDIMAFIREWPSHIPRIGEPATIEGILNCLDSFGVLVGEQFLPALMQTTV